MADITTERFLEAYGNLLVKCWGSPPLMARLHKEPEVVLKSFGLDPEKAKVNILPPGPPGPHATPESQVRLWNEGKNKGKIDLYVPEAPPREIADHELTDAELEAVAGGGWSISCCSCTPCCCC